MEYQKDFDRWHVFKKVINNERAPLSVKEGCVYWCSLGVNIGSEIDGKNTRFTRPVVVIKRINLRSAIIVPLTSKYNPDKKYQIKISSFNNSFAVASQIKQISTNRIIRFSAEVIKSEFEQLIDLVVNMIKNENPD